MFCDQCGAKIGSGNKFCPQCGAPVLSQDADVFPGEQDKTEAYRDGLNERYRGNDERTAAYHEDDERTMAYHEDDERTMAYHEDDERTMAYHEDDERTMAYHEDDDRTVAYHEDGQGYYGRSGGSYQNYSGQSSYDQNYYGQQPGNRPSKNHKPWLYAILGVAAVLFVVFIGIEVKTILSLDSEEEETETVAEADSQEAEDQEEASEENAQDQVVPQATPTSTPLPTATPIPTATPVPQTQNFSSGGYLNNDYIFPDSSYRELSESEFADKTEWELKVARNEIYARHGRMFDTPELDAHFRSKIWYTPSIPAAQFDDQSILNSVEPKNATKILNYELAHGMET